MSRTVELYYHGITREAEKALLVAFDNSEAWIPFSQIIEDDKNNQRMTIPEWLAIEKGLV